MSSLANQLSQIASLDASRLTSRGGHPSSKSYLFPPKVAASHDLDAIFSLAQSGFEELLSFDPDFEQFEDELFSDRAKATDRMLLNKKENEQLDVVLGKCLRRLGKWVGIMAGGKCIEWLVRRFRVHEMNAEVLLQVFLPYHSAPNFPRILAILTLPIESPWHAPFVSLIKNAQPIPRTYITAAISPEREKSLRLLEDVAGLLRDAIKEGVVHRALLAFWTGTMVELLEKAKAGKGAGEGLVKVLVETFVDILVTKRGEQDVNAAVYPPLILLTRTVALADGPFLALLSALLTPKSGANASQRTLTLLVVLNERKGWKGGLGSNAALHLSKVEEVGRILAAALEKYDFEVALDIILSVLCEEPALNQQHLAHIIDIPLLPSSLVKAIAYKALLIGSKPDISTESKSICKDLLASLREKYPTVIDVASQETPDLDPSLIDRPAGEVALVNALSADVSSRVQGINALLKPLLVDGTAGLSSDERGSISTTVLARLRDTEPAILDVLYQSPEIQSVIVEICGVGPIVQAITPAFTQNKINDNIIGQHLAFAANHLVDSPAGSRLVFEQLVFPVLLPTESRRLSQQHWEILRTSKLAHHELLKNLLAGEREDLAGLAAKLAGAIKASPDLEHHISLLLQQLSSELPSKLLGHLVLANLLKVLPGAKQVDTSLQVLNALQPLLRTAALPDLNPSEVQLLDAVRKHPFALKTSQKASVYLLVVASHVKRPSGLINWFTQEKVSQLSYGSLATSVYIWSNTLTASPNVGKTLLRSLLVQLGEDALLFFASIWTSHVSPALRISALRHATAFVHAYSGSAQKGTDFQLIIPSILLALASEQRSIREAASQLLESVAKSVRSATGTVYALDTIYGDRSSSVQLLKQTDLSRYVDNLTSVENEYAVDASRVLSIHSQILSHNSGETRKDVSYRRAVIGSLSSHVVAWRSAHRIDLLRILANIRDPAALRGLLPVLTSTASDASEQLFVANLQAKEKKLYYSLLVDHITPGNVGVLHEEEGAGWKFVKTVLAASNDLRGKLLERMENGVFDALSQPQKAELIEALLDSLVSISTDDVLATKAALSRLELDPSVLVEVFNNLSAHLETTFHKKKQRADESHETEQAERLARTVQSLSTLIETRTWKSLPGDALLLATLMSLLSTLLAKRQSVKEGIDYLEQEILGAVLSIVEKITDPAEIAKAHVGIEVIIKVIRASTNPRTSQRALLVAAELARLIPEAVLHNIMPIFTFMGASDFQRDDAYSFGVVEKTVSRIVPVMTKSLREKATNPLDLYKESKTFISIFTDMASRLPKHRTLPFFTHLVKSLGPEDFLAPICMLLVERSTSKSSRGGMSAGQALELPHSLAAIFETDIKLEVVLQSALEATRIVGDLEKEEEEREAFLATPSRDADRTLRLLAALMTFSTTLAKSLAGKQCDQSVAEEIVKRLLLLTSTVSTSSISNSGIPAAVQNFLGASMSLLSAAKFLGVVKTLLIGEDEQAVNVSLNILVERLPRIKPEVRVQNATVISDILKAVTTLVRPAGKSSSSALAALHAITSSAQKSEDGALAETVGKLIGIVTTLDISDQVATLSILDIAARHLTSRIIPYIQSIVETTLKLITFSSSSSIARQAFTLQSALIDVVPTFIASKQLITLLRTAVAYDKEELSKPVISAVAKKVPTKTIFPVVMDLWKVVQSEGQAALLGFFDLLRLVLRNADRKALPTLVKPIFAFFLDVFDLRHRLKLKKVDEEVINRIEESCIGSFLELVTKLNEATFKPLFIRLYDWAVVDLADGTRMDDERLTERRIVILHIMKGLLNKFKNLLSPYIGTLLPHIQELLQAYNTGDLDHVGLWTLMLDVLGRSFDVDEGAFWTEPLLTPLIPLLISQLGVFPDLPHPSATCLGALAGGTTSEIVLKKLNTDICMVTRDDDHRIRMAGLMALDAIWARQPDELLQFVPETVSEFLVELLEDENSDVEALARGVLGRIEKLTGSLKEYLE